MYTNRVGDKLKFKLLVKAYLVSFVTLCLLVGLTFIVSFSDVVFSQQFNTFSMLKSTMFIAVFNTFLCSTFYMFWQSRMQKIEQVLLHARHGKFDAQLVIKENDPFNVIMQGFNDFSVYVNNLIEGQKEIVRAVSHELRTPVARVRFGIEVMAVIPDENARMQKVEELDQDIEELDVLIDEILTFSTLDQRKLDLDIENLSLQQLAHQIKGEVEMLQSGKFIEVIGFTDVFAEGEHRYIHRALQNLVTNAIKYANKKVRISYSSAGGMARLDVEDDGEGIPKEDWERVFAPFARLDDSRTRATGGYGLGLSIVNKILRLHDGVASVYRSPMGGAKFTLLWPKHYECLDLKSVS